MSRHRTTDTLDVLIFKTFSTFAFLAWWAAGVAVAKGAWSTIAAIVLFPYALYLTIEKAIMLLG